MNKIAEILKLVKEVAEEENITELKLAQQLVEAMEFKELMISVLKG